MKISAILKVTIGFGLVIVIGLIPNFKQMSLFNSILLILQLLSPALAGVAALAISTLLILFSPRRFYADLIIPIAGIAGALTVVNVLFFLPPGSHIFNPENTTQLIPVLIFIAAYGLALSITTLYAGLNLLNLLIEKIEKHD